MSTNKELMRLPALRVAVVLAVVGDVNDETGAAIDTVVVFIFHTFPIAFSMIENAVVFDMSNGVDGFTTDFSKS